MAMRSRLRARALWAAAAAAAAAVAAWAAAGARQAVVLHDGASPRADGRSAAWVRRARNLTVWARADSHSRAEALRSGRGGYAAAAAALAAERALAGAGGAVIALDGGDWMQGTPYARLGGAAELDAMRELRLDAFTLGNHDLDAGVEALVGALDGARARGLGAALVLTNLRAGGALEGRAERSVLVERGGVRVGVLGLMPPNPAYMTRKVRVDAKARDAALAVEFVGFDDATRRWDLAAVAAVAEAEARELVRRGADLVVALMHGGRGDEDALARRAPTIDVVLGAHTHDDYDRFVQRAAPPPAADGAQQPAVAAGCFITQCSAGGNGERASVLRLALLDAADVPPGGGRLARWGDGHACEQVVAPRFGSGGESGDDGGDVTDGISAVAQAAAASMEEHLGSLRAQVDALGYHAKWAPLLRGGDGGAGPLSFLDEVYRASAREGALTADMDREEFGRAIWSLVHQGLNRQLEAKGEAPVDVYISPVGALRVEPHHFFDSETGDCVIRLSECYEALALGADAPVAVFYLQDKHLLRALDLSELLPLVKGFEFQLAFSDTVNWRINRWGVPFVNRAVNVTLHGQPLPREDAEEGALVSVGISSHFLHYLTDTSLWFDMMDTAVRNRNGELVRTDEDMQAVTLHDVPPEPLLLLDALRAQAQS